MIKVSQDYVDKFIKWSTFPFENETIYDKRMVHAMLVLCCTKKELSDGIIIRDVMQFIERTYTKRIYPFQLNFWFHILTYFTDLLFVRVKGDSARLAEFPTYVEDMLSTKRKN